MRSLPLLFRIALCLPSLYVLCQLVPHNALLAVLCCPARYHAVPCEMLVHQAVLYHVVLYYVFLCCAVLGHPSGGAVHMKFCSILCCPAGKKAPLLFRLLGKLPHWARFSSPLPDQDTMVNAKQVNVVNGANLCCCVVNLGLWSISCRTWEGLRTWRALQSKRPQPLCSSVQRTAAVAGSEH